MSRGFRFRLEPVLRHRARREELLQQDLAQALRALADQQERAVASERAVEAELAALRRMMESPTELATLRSKHADLALARARAAHERRTSDQLEQVALERRADLVGASQDREALARLRERAHADHRREEARREGARLDELALRRATTGAGGRAAA